MENCHSGSRMIILLCSQNTHTVRNNVVVRRKLLQYYILCALPAKPTTTL